MNYKKWLYCGIAIFVASILIGAVGTVWEIHSSFEALDNAENAGIGAVGSGIQNALVFSILGLIGSAAGAVFILIGGIKAYKISKNKAIISKD